MDTSFDFFMDTSFDFNAIQFARACIFSLLTLSVKVIAARNREPRAERKPQLSRSCIARLTRLFCRIIVFSQFWARVYLLRGAARVLRKSKAERVVRVFHFGDWFLLQQLAENVNPVVYRELVNEIAKAFATKSFANFA